MNYSCGNDALSSSKLNELIHLNVSTPNKLYNGTMKNVTDQDSQSLESSNQLEKHIQLKSNLFQKVDECYELGLNNKKLKFSEKLKVLLKNGGNKSEKVDLNDPYTFSEIDSQYGIPSDQALCDVDSIVQKSSLPNVKSNNVPTQKSIIFPKSVVPKLLVNNAGVKNEFSSETKNNYTSMKLAKLSVPVYSSNNALVANQTSYKVSSSSTADKFKTVNSRNARAIASHFSANNRHFLEKAGSKPILQNVKPSTHLNNAVRVNKSVSGKPHSFGQTQLVRHAGAKPERKTEGKSKNFAKGKSLLNQLQKTVSLNKTIAKPRKIPSKAYITTGKSILAQSELPFSNNKNFNKRSLLEESLLGMRLFSSEDYTDFSM